MKGSFGLGAAFAATLVSALIAVPVVAGGPDGRNAGVSQKRTKVRVMDNFFDPRSTTIAAGEKVTFVWKGSNRHNVRFTKVPRGTSRKGSKIKREGRWTRRFGKAGTYKYVCTLFSGMRGTVTVEPPKSER